MTILQKISLTF